MGAPFVEGAKHTATFQRSAQAKGTRKAAVFQNDNQTRPGLMQPSSDASVFLGKYFVIRLADFAMSDSGL